MKLDFESFPPSLQKIMLSLFVAAIGSKKDELSKEQFLEFCHHIWETMELNGVERLEFAIKSHMLNEIEKKMEADG
jgi:hypothetical protein